MNLLWSITAQLRSEVRCANCGLGGLLRMLYPLPLLDRMPTVTESGILSGSMLTTQLLISDWCLSRTFSVITFSVTGFFVWSDW